MLFFRSGKTLTFSRSWGWWPLRLFLCLRFSNTVKCLHDMDIELIFFLHVSRGSFGLHTNPLGILKEVKVSGTKLRYRYITCREKLYTDFQISECISLISHMILLFGISKWWFEYCIVRFSAKDVYCDTECAGSCGKLSKEHRVHAQWAYNLIRLMDLIHYINKSVNHF